MNIEETINNFPKDKVEQLNILLELFEELKTAHYDGSLEQNLLDLYNVSELIRPELDFSIKIETIDKIETLKLDPLYDAVERYFNSIKNQVESRIKKNKTDKVKEFYENKFLNRFHYEFTDGDISRIQKLINELRELLSKSNQFKEEHKTRLLARLEKLQSEMHKTMNNLDIFWGIMGDAGVALGKFGVDAKPFVDRITEITRISWKAQARAEELSSESELPFQLPHVEEN